MSLHLPRLGDDPRSPFPDPSTALQRPNGLLAFGGGLEPTRLLTAYAAGIFPWFSDGQPILWWSPDPRMVFRTDGVHLSTRFRRRLRASHWTVGADRHFDLVVRECAGTPRPGQDGTWITPAMADAYSRLHALGHAHSIEVRDGDRLVGGLYGVAVGRMFFGESMYSAESGGSSVALAALAHRLRGWNWPLIDAQVENPHLLRLGAEAWPRQKFLAEVRVATGERAIAGSWADTFGILPARDLADPAACPPEQG